MTSAQMTKTVDQWTDKQKQDLIAEVKTLIGENTTYDSDDVIQVVLIGSYVWGTPTAESDVDVLVEVALRDYTRPSHVHTPMADGKILSVKIRDNSKPPTIVQAHRQRWDLSRYSLTFNKMYNGADNEAFDAFRNA